MNQQEKRKIARKVRIVIKSLVAQLDVWEESQRKLRKQREAADALNGGRRQRLIDSRRRAQIAQGTEALLDPPCDLCGLSTHLSDECDFIAVETNGSLFENPSSGIHRGIVHRLFEQSAYLYKFLYPGFFPGNFGGSPAAIEAVPFRSGSLERPPDYQTLGISQAIALAKVVCRERCLDLSSPQQAICLDQVSLPFFSASFPIGFAAFREQVLEGWQGSDGG